MNTTLVQQEHVKFEHSIHGPSVEETVCELTLLGLHTFTKSQNPDVLSVVL